MVNQDDSFIREVNDELRSDQMRVVWKRFGRVLIAAAVLQLSVDADEAFLRPKQLWTAIAAYRQRQIGKALKGAHGPVIPADVAGDPDQEIWYRRAWMAFAAVLPAPIIPTITTVFFNATMFFPVCLDLQRQIAHRRPKHIFLV